MDRERRNNASASPGKSERVFMRGTMHKCRFSFAGTRRIKGVRWAGRIVTWMHQIHFLCSLVGKADGLGQSGEKQMSTGHRYALLVIIDMDFRDMSASFRKDASGNSELSVL